MSLDVVFQHAAETAEFTNLLKALETGSKVDTKSASFMLVLELSIRNGEEAVFAKLIRCIPKLTLKAKSQMKQSQRDQIRLSWWKLAPLVIVGVAIEIFSRFFYYRALFFVLRNIIHCCSGKAKLASSWGDHRLFNSRGPVSLWIFFLPFRGIQARFSRKFLLESLDTGLVFLGLGIAARFVSPSTWIGTCIYEAQSSFISFKGICTRDILKQYMPSWRRMYFSVVLGPDHALATPAESKSLPPEGDHSVFILGQLLSRKCKNEALMLQYLNLVTFDDINETCGPGHEIFVWAAQNGYVQVVQILLDLGIDANIDASNVDGFRFGTLPLGSALFWAAVGGHADVVDALLCSKAEIKEDNPSLSPLIGVTENSTGAYSETIMQTYVQCVVLLLRAGANPNTVDREGRSALSWCTQPNQKPLLELLLDAGADPNAPDQDMTLPLHYAAQYARSQEIVRILLTKTSSPNSVDKNGTSALTWALWSAECHPTIELLLDVVSDINSGGGIYGCPLGAASRYCSSTIIKMLLDKGADPNVMGSGRYGSCLAALLHRPFNSVVFEDDLLCLQLLLSSGADPNLRMKNKKRALHVAASCCYHPEIFEMLLRYGADVNDTFDSREQGLKVITTPLGIVCDSWVKKDAAMVLLRAGANPNCYTPNGRTPLQAACDILGKSQVAQELIKRGADVRARSTVNGTTALHNAATAARSDLINELIEHGADVDARDNKMKTPLHYALWRTPDRDILQDEIENPFEARRSLYMREGEIELRQSIRLLLVLGQANPKARDNEGATTLHHAVKAGNTVSAETLISLTSTDLVFEQDNQGKLPLHWAADKGFTGVFCSLIRFYHVDGLDDSENARPPKWELQRYVNARDNFGNTALHYAAQNGHDNFVKALLLEQIRVDTSIRNHVGHTALDLAKANNQAWVVAQLKDVEIKVNTCHVSVQDDLTLPSGCIT